MPTLVNKTKSSQICGHIQHFYYVYTQYNNPPLKHVADFLSLNTIFGINIAKTDYINY